MINLENYQQPFFDFFAQRIRERESLTLPTGETLYFDGDGDYEGLDRHFNPMTKSGDAGLAPDGYVATLIYGWGNANNSGATYCFHPPHIKAKAVLGFGGKYFSVILEEGETEKDFFDAFIISQKMFDKKHIALLLGVDVPLTGKELYYESYSPHIPKSEIQPLLDRGLYYYPYTKEYEEFQRFLNR